MTPEEMLKHLKQDANPRTCRTLDAIYIVCNEIRKVNSINFSYANVANLGKGKGCPSAQSIRNKSGEKYQILIQSFSESAKIDGLKKENKKEGWIEAIDDPKLRLMVRMQAAEIKKLKAILSEIVSPSKEIVVREGKMVVETERLSNLERSALEHLISDDFFREWKFKKGERGEICDEKGLRIFPVATVDAIEKALNNL